MQKSNVLRKEPIISERVKELLLGASKEFEEGRSPFEGEWLRENHVKFDECMSLSSLIGCILQGFAIGPIIAQEMIMLAYATGGINNDSITSIVLMPDLVKRMENIGTENRGESESL